MKKVLSFILAFAMVVLTATTAFATEDYPAAFSFAEAKEKGILYDKPLTEKSHSELINDGFLFYGGTVPWIMPIATVSNTYGYVTASGETTVYSGKGTGTKLGYVTLKEVVYVTEISGSYAKIQFKNDKGILTSGYIPSSSVYTPAYNWSRPITTGTITQFYGDTITDPSGHTGVDVSASSGTAVYAVNAGTVTYYETYKLTSTGQNYFANYGKHAVLSTTATGVSSSIAALYGHLSKFGNNVNSSSYPSEGYPVPDNLQGLTVTTKKIETKSASKESTIGYVGSTGLSSGNHLHFELRVNDRLVDPFAYVVFPDVQWGK